MLQTCGVAESGTARATLEIETGADVGRIDRRIFGHFLEGNFFGNIQGGVFDEGSPLALDGPGVTRGLRRDVIEACRGLGLPVVRWPGGNYASAYHWEDGIGPRDARPRRLELTWGGREGMPLEEDNRFGTDEFLAWCALVGAEPYLNNSSRSVEEAWALLRHIMTPPMQEIFMRATGAMVGLKALAESAAFLESPRRT